MTAIVVALLLAGFVLDQRRERLRNDRLADFSYESRELAVRLSGQLTGYRQVIRGARALLTATGHTTQDAWASYVDNLFLQSDFPGLELIGFAPKVALADLAVHEQRVRATAFPNYRVQNTASEMAPVVRSAPTSASEALFGINLLTIEPLREAMERAASTGQSTMSEPISNEMLGRRGDDRRVFLFLPVYRSEPANDRQDTKQRESTRRERIFGWVFGAFRIDEMVRRTLEPLPRQTTLQVLAGTPGNKPRSPLYTSPGFDGRSATSHPDEPLQIIVPLEFDGLPWTLQFEGQPRGYSPDQGTVSADIVAVLLICVLFGLATLFATMSRLQAIRLARMAEELRISNDRYEFLATHDALTQVANRMLFQRTLDALVAHSNRDGTPFALIYIDLDKFKQVNDVMGHEAGDQVLIEATRRLSALLRSSDMVARRGGDEFVVLLSEIDATAGPSAVARKICEALAAPIALTNGKTAQIAGSLGIALFPEDGRDSEKLIQMADVRMYRAKQRGGNQWVADDKTAT